MSGLQITPSAQYPFGCRIEGVDIRDGMSDQTAQQISDALNQYLVVCVSGEPYDSEQLVHWAKKSRPS